MFAHTDSGSGTALAYFETVQSGANTSPGSLGAVRRFGAAANLAASMLRSFHSVKIASADVLLWIYSDGKRGNK